MKKNDQMHGSFLGPKFNKNQIKESLNRLGAKYKEYEKKKLLKMVKLMMIEVDFFQ